MTQLHLSSYLSLCTFETLAEKEASCPSAPLKNMKNGSTCTPNSTQNSKTLSQLQNLHASNQGSGDHMCNDCWQQHPNRVAVLNGC